MSEYQYYEFLAVDRPLTRAQMSELRAHSTRARITATGFVNEYQWGVFKGDEDAWMECYFDAFLYVANWGTNILKLRVPTASLDAKTARAYCKSDRATARSKNDCTLLSFISEAEADEVITGDGLLATMVSVREELARGDLRALYLGWLLGVQQGALDDQEREPPVPAGLNDLSASLEALRGFLRVDADLVAAAGRQSAPLERVTIREEPVLRWVETIPAKEKDRLLARLIAGDDRAGVRDRCDARKQRVWVGGYDAPDAPRKPAECSPGAASYVGVRLAAARAEVQLERSAGVPMERLVDADASAPAGVRR